MVLIVVGWLDFLVVLLALFPCARLYAMGYAAFWGLVTAFSRVVCNFTAAENFYGMHPWMAEWVVRNTHGLVPLAMLLVAMQWTAKRKQSGRAHEVAAASDSGD